MNKHGENTCCVNCANRYQESFQPVANLKDLGVMIMRYVADVIKQNMHPFGQLSMNLHDHDPKSNIFIIINANNNSLSSKDILPMFDLSKVTCPRCRLRAENLQKMLQSDFFVGKGDIKGICDHCKDKQLSLPPCDICGDIVNTFLEATGTSARTAKSWFQQRGTHIHIHRPMSSERITRVKKYKLRKESKSKTDLDVKLQILKAKPEIDTVKPQRKEKAVDKPKYTPKVVEFSSDESIVTTFLTTFSQVDKKTDDKIFHYIFPKDVKKYKDTSKPSIPTSAELIMDIQEKILKQSEEEKKMEVPKHRFDELAHGRDGKILLRGKMEETKSEDFKAKQIKAKHLLLSVDSYWKGKEKHKKDQLEARKEKAEKVQEVVKKLSPKIFDVKKSQKDIKQQPPILTKASKSKMVQEGNKPPSLKYINDQKDEDSLPPKAIRIKEGQKQTEPLTPKEEKAKNFREDLGPRPSDVKSKKAEVPVYPPSSKEVTTKKEKDVNLSPKEAVESSTKEVRTKKSKEDKGPPPPLPKQTKAKKGKEDVQMPIIDKDAEGPPPPKDIKDKKVKEDAKQLSPKDVKTGKKDIGPPEPKPLSKDKKGDKQVTVIPSKLNAEAKAAIERAKKERAETEREIKKQEAETQKKLKEKQIEKKEGKKARGAKQVDENGDKKKGKGDKGKDEAKDKTQVKIKEKEKKEDARDKETAKGQALDDSKILKLLPQKCLVVPVKGQKIPDSAVAKALAMKTAADEVDKMLKDIQAKALEKARSEAAKRFGLPEVHAGEYNLFKLTMKEPPTEVLPQREKKKKLKEFNLRRLKLRGLSYEDLMFKLMKMSKYKKEKRDKKLKIQGKYRIRSVKRARSFSSLSIDSDVELAFESLTNVTKFEVVRYKIKDIHIVREIPETPKPKFLPDPMLFQTVLEKDAPLEVFDLEKESSEVKLPPFLGAGKGVMRYRLSDSSFIDKGWTKLPTEKIVRRMNIYKVRPANPELDWFNHNRTKDTLEYDTGEKMAQFDEHGRGQWYYRNGRIALDYYDCEDTNAQQRFVIYSDGEPNKFCRTLPVSVLAMFDYLGNGVVFDHSGKIRVKYNQTEGVILDRDIGPFTRWKWHSLNDPPVLKKVMIDTYTEIPDPKIMKIGHTENHIDKTQVEDEEMLAIELDNFVKERAKKLKQNFQPFQIKMKALKINEYFSLKILDQAHIYLRYRDGTTNVKLNLGMILDNQEIIDTETADFLDVANVLEHVPPKTDSILDLQNALRHTRHLDRIRTDRTLKIRPVLPVCSADRLISAISKPLRPKINAAQPANIINGRRKPSQTNLYYDTRII